MSLIFNITFEKFANPALIYTTSLSTMTHEKTYAATSKYAQLYIISEIKRIVTQTISTALKLTLHQRNKPTQTNINALTTNELLTFPTYKTSSGLTGRFKNAKERCFQVYPIRNTYNRAISSNARAGKTKIVNCPKIQSLQVIQPYRLKRPFLINRKSDQSVTILCKKENTISIPVDQ